MKKLSEQEGHEDSLGQAIDAYGRALEVRERARHPLKWALTTENLALALYLQAMRTGDLAAAEAAVQGFENCIEVFEGPQLDWNRAKVETSLSEARALRDAIRSTA